MAEELADAAHAGTRPLCGLLRLGVIPTIGPYLLPHVSPLLRTRHPDLRLYLREDQTANLIALLNKGRLDTSIIALPYDVGSLETWVLGEDRLFMACPVGHSLAGRDRVSAEELLEEKWLLLEDGHCLRDHALTTCHLRPGQTHEDFQATSLGTLVQMVANGLGITLLPEIAVDSEAGADSGITVVPISDGNPVRRLAMCWRRGSPRAHEFVLLGEVFREHLSQRTGLI
jgi:LysR family hydrogen peroxide-inducible transcriptional activator